MWPSPTADRRVRPAAVLLGVLASGVLGTGCSTIDLNRSLFEAGREYQRRQWELRENRPALDVSRPRYEDYEQAREARLRTPD